MDHALRPPEYIEWTENGQTFRQVSAPWKRDLLLAYAERFNLRIFVETGTCGGDTVEAMRGHFDHIYSIELNSDLYGLGVRRFIGVPGITLIHGDSAISLPNLLPQITEPALYWLDAHTSGPGTAYGPANPLMVELESIMAQKKQGIILIDDMDFGRETSWEHGILRVML
jgi:hypothetical protein